jgi:hypothetical protein
MRSPFNLRKKAIGEECLPKQKTQLAIPTYGLRGGRVGHYHCSLKGKKIEHLIDDDENDEGKKTHCWQSLLNGDGDDEYY